MEGTKDKHPLECPICTSSKESPEFKKILFVKEIDVDIYMRRASEIERMEKISETLEAAQPEQENRDFIFFNNSDLTVTSVEMLAFLDITKIPCPRCRYALEKLQNIVVSLPIIQRNEIRGICNHCFAKLQYDLACEHCKEIRDKFALAKGIRYKEQPTERVRTQSEIELYGLLLEQALPIPRHDINIESLFHSGTELYLDIFEKETTPVVPKVEVQDEEIMQASVIEVQEKVEEEDLGPVNVRFAEEPVVVKSDELKPASPVEDLDDSEDVETRDFALKMAKEKMERALEKKLQSARRKAISGDSQGGIGILKQYKDVRKDMERKKRTEPPKEELSRRALGFDSFQKTMPVQKDATDVFVEKRYKDILKKLEAQREKKFSARIKKRKSTKSHSSVRFKSKTKFITPIGSDELLTSRKRKKRPRSAKSGTTMKSILKHDSYENISAKLRALSIFKKYASKKEATTPKDQKQVQPITDVSKSRKKRKKKEEQALRVYKDILVPKKDYEFIDKGEKTDRISKTKKTFDKDEISTFKGKSFKAKSKKEEDWEIHMKKKEKTDRISKTKKTFDKDEISTFKGKSFKVKTEKQEDWEIHIKKNKLAKEKTYKFLSDKGFKRKRRGIISRKMSKDSMDEHAEEKEDKTRRKKYKLTEEEYQKLVINIKAKRIKPVSISTVKLKKKIIAEKKRRRSKSKTGFKKKHEVLEDESELKFLEKKEFKLQKLTQQGLTDEKFPTDRRSPKKQDSQPIGIKTDEPEVKIQEGKAKEIEGLPIEGEEEDILKKVISKSKTAGIRQDKQKQLESKKDVSKSKLLYRDYDRRKGKFKATIKSDPDMIEKRDIYKMKKGKQIFKAGDPRYKEKLKLKEKYQDEGKKLLKAKIDKTKYIDYGKGLQKEKLTKVKSALSQGDTKKPVKITKDKGKKTDVDHDSDREKKTFKRSKNALSQGDTKKPSKITKHKITKDISKKTDVDADLDEKTFKKGKTSVSEDDTTKKVTKTKGKGKKKVVDEDEGYQLQKFKSKEKRGASRDERKRKIGTKKVLSDEEDFYSDTAESKKKTRAAASIKTKASKSDITAPTSMKDKHLELIKDKMKETVSKKGKKSKTYESDSEAIPSEKLEKTDIHVSEDMHEVPGETEANVESEESESKFQVQEQFIQEFRLLDVKKQAMESKKTKSGAHHPDGVSASEGKGKKQAIEEKKKTMEVERISDSIDASDEKLEKEEKDEKTVKTSQTSIKTSVSEENKQTLQMEIKIIRSLLKKSKQEVQKKPSLPLVQKQQKKKQGSQPDELDKKPSPIDLLKPVTEKKSLPVINEKRLRQDDPKRVKSLLKKQHDILNVLLGTDKHRRKKDSDEQDYLEKLETERKRLLSGKKKTKSATADEKIPSKYDIGTQILIREMRSRDHVGLTEVENLLLKGKRKTRRLKRAKTTPSEAKTTESSETESLPSGESPERQGKYILPEIIVGNKIYKEALAPPIEEKKEELEPILFKTSYEAREQVDETMSLSSEVPTSYSPEGSIKVEKRKLHGKRVKPLGVISYRLSDPTFIDKGWTLLPTEKVVRKVPIYRMHLAGNDWFEYNMERGEVMRYCSDEILAKYYRNGCGRWYYKNGRIALDSYESDGITGKRIVLYSDGEPDDRGRTYPVTVLAIFDYNGNGIVFDHTGNIRLKYNQIEGVVLDPEISPLTHWKWHDLEEFPEDLFTVPVEEKLSPEEAKLMSKKRVVSEYEIGARPRVQENRMLKIEFENYVKQQTSRKKKSFRKPYKYLEIRMKYFKINKYFSLKILDQKKIRLTYKCDSDTLKFDLGMILDQKHVIDTEFVDAGKVVFNCMERCPAKTDSILFLQRLRENSMRAERARHNRAHEWKSAAVIAREKRAQSELPPLQRPCPEFFAAAAAAAAAAETTAVPATTPFKRTATLRK